MQDPSNGVAQLLLPHVHLLSAYRYPLVQHLQTEQVVEYLLQAPRIAREHSPFAWTYLDAPVDGSIHLAWQPLAALGTEFASDGYTWVGAEQAFQLDVKGYNLEMYQYQSGFRPGVESVLSHSRRRYRLTSSKNQVPGQPQPDPTLFLIHYSQCDIRMRLPTQQIPLTQQSQQVIQTRRYLQSQGQIVRKEFMLHDRANWPTVNLPTGRPQGPYQQGGMYAGPQMGNTARGPQPPYYPAQPPQMQPSNLGPPAKRPRQTPPSHGAGSSAAMAAAAGMAHDTSIDDEEDTSRGDMLDHLTPREISVMRYTQHHEWMEEIMSSPYKMSQIVPVELGLGLRGELEVLTSGIFEAPVGETPKRGASPGRVGKMDVDKAEEFRRRATEKIAAINADMEKMKQKHAKRMEKLNRGVNVKDGERKLRSAVADPSDIGTEFWRLEGKIEITENDDHKVDVGLTTRPKESVDGIVKDVEVSVGKKIVPTQELIQVEKGGLEEHVPSNHANSIQDQPFNSGASNNDLLGDGDIEMSNSAADLLNQYGASSTSTPGGNLSTPNPLNSHLHPLSSSSNTPANTLSPHIPPPQLSQSSAPVRPTVPSDSMDIDMGNTGEPSASGSGAPPESDWVMVPKDGVSPVPLVATAPSTSVPIVSMASHTTAIATASSSHAGTPASAPFVHTPGSGLGLTPGATGSHGFSENGTDFTAGLNMDDGDVGLGEAGEALASFDTAADELDLEGALDDSAFGEAFHGVEARGEEGEGGDGGM